MTLNVVMAVISRYYTEVAASNCLKLDVLKRIWFWQYVIYCDTRRDYEKGIKSNNLLNTARQLENGARQDVSITH